VTGRLRTLGILATGICIGLLVAAVSASALKRSVLADLFGPGLIRAQVVIWGGGQDTEIWFSKGRVTALGGGSITLRERDGQVERIAIAPGARVTLGNVLVSQNALRRGMQASVFRPGGDAPANRVDATFR
jgi:hypothetical protein